MSKCLDTYASQLDTIATSLGDEIRARRLYVTTEPRAQRVIFGAGFGTTATRSLYSALTIIGLNGEHWGPTNHGLAKILGRDKHTKHDMSVGDATCKRNLTTMFPGTWHYDQDFLMDTPCAELFMDIFATYPHAKFILTNRPSKEWV